MVRSADPAAVVATVRDAGLTVLAADAYGDQDLDLLADDGALDGPTAWLFGSEAHGLPDDLAEAPTPGCACRCTAGPRALTWLRPRPSACTLRPEHCADDDRVPRMTRRLPLPIVYSARRRRSVTR